jgi:hypothetical protein
MPLACSGTWVMELGATNGFFNRSASPKTPSDPEINSLHNFLNPPICYVCPMFRFLLLWWGAIFRLFRSRRDLLVENLALRHSVYSSVETGGPNWAGRGCIVSHPRVGGLHHRYERAA